MPRQTGPSCFMARKSSQAELMAATEKEAENKRGTAREACSAHFLHLKQQGMVPPTIKMGPSPSINVIKVIPSQACPKVHLSPW